MLIVKLRYVAHTQSLITLDPLGTQTNKVRHSKIRHTHSYIQTHREPVCHIESGTNTVTHTRTNNTHYTHTHYTHTHTHTHILARERIRRISFCSPVSL